MYFQWQDGGWADIVRNSTYYRLEKEYFIIISLLFLYMILYEYYRTNKNGLSLNKIKSIYIFMFTYRHKKFYQFKKNYPIKGLHKTVFITRSIPSKIKYLLQLMSGKRPY